LIFAANAGRGGCVGERVRLKKEIQSIGVVLSVQLVSGVSMFRVLPINTLSIPVLYVDVLTDFGF
jgi:hypothetical protein